MEKRSLNVAFSVLRSAPHYLYINAGFHGLNIPIYLRSESAVDASAFSSSIDTFHLICLFSLYCNIFHAQIKSLLKKPCYAKHFSNFWFLRSSSNATGDERVSKFTATTSKILGVGYHIFRTLFIFQSNK